MCTLQLELQHTVSTPSGSYAKLPSVGPGRPHLSLGGRSGDRLRAHSYCAMLMRWRPSSREASAWQRRALMEDSSSLRASSQWARASLWLPALMAALAAASAARASGLLRSCSMFAVMSLVLSHWADVSKSQ